MKTNTDTAIKPEMEQKPAENIPGPFQMTFWEHLHELRGRLIKCCLAIAAASVVFSWLWLDTFLQTLIRPVGYVVFTSPSDALGARIILAAVGGIFLSLPYLLYEIWDFVSAGLKPVEKKSLAALLPVFLFLFLAGGMFAYILVVPFTMKFLLGFSNEFIQPMITLKNYIWFVGSILLSFGLVFELPLVLFFLARIGIATPAFLRQKRRHAIVVILAVSAVITPPDVVSLLIMCLPLIALYEIGIVVCSMVETKKPAQMIHH